MKLLNTTFFKSGGRSANIKKNILVSFILKGISIGINFLLVPITLHYLDKEKYGLWLTISSLISWFTLFDIGLGNGFRNKFAEAKALGNEELAKKYVSTTFALLTIIMGIVLVVFLSVQPFLNWSGILNAPPALGKELSWLVIVCFALFCLQFIFKLTTTLLLADHKAAKADLANVLGSVLSLIIIASLIYFTANGSLFLLGIAMTASPVIVLVITYFVLFTGRYKFYKPSIKYVDFSYSRGLLSLGIHFFIVQLAAVVVYSTSNIVISQLLGPAQVTTYTVPYRYFTVLSFLFQIILNPFWSAFTEAYVVNDKEWIKRSMKKLTAVWFGLCLFSVFMLFIAPFVYKVWMGNAVQVPVALSVSYAVYVCVGNWNYIFVSFNFGVSKVRLQLYLSAFAGLVNIPLTIILIKIWGLPGDVIAMTLSILPGSFLSPLQYRKIINGTAKGIWNK